MKENINIYKIYIKIYTNINNKYKNIYKEIISISFLYHKYNF